MRTLFSIIACACLLLLSAPAITHAAPVYFSADGVSSQDQALSHDFILNQAGGLDITLVGRGPANWSIASGRLPTGLGFVVVANGAAQSTITLSGTPTEEGTFPVRFLAFANDTPYYLDFTVNTYAQTLTVQPIGVAQGRVGLPYSQQLTVGGSISVAPSISWVLMEGDLPPGVYLDISSGLISGTPTTAGTYNYVITAEERTGRLRSTTPRGYVHTIQAATVNPVQITTRSNPVNGRVGTAYPAQIFRAQGGTGSFTWAVVSGSLPPGLSLGTTSGILEGTPTVAGNYSFRVKANDSTMANSDELTVSMTIAAAVSSVPTIPTTPTTPTALTVLTTSLPGATVGVDYTATLSASGGTSPYTWNFASGNLPSGLTLSANGTISGRPTTAGTYTAYIEAFDALGHFVGRSQTIVVANASTPTTPTTPSGSVELTTRLNNLARIGVSVHALVKLPDDGNRFTQADSAVYYIGADGRRHAFPNDRVFFSWYANFDSVRVVSASDLASIALGANATYKPGVKMVKFTTDPKVYAVGANHSLRWVNSEAAAISLYGSNWNRQIDDIADTFYTDYTFGAAINAASDYDRTGIQANTRFVSDTLSL